MPVDYKKYPANWKTEIRPAILERDGNCCKFCGVENGRLIRRFGAGVNDWEYWPEGMMSVCYTEDGYKSIKIVLTIMHLDHDITNNDYSNLAAGCQRCHLNYDKDHHAKSRQVTIGKKKKQIHLF